MDSSNWVNIPSEDLDDVIVYLYNYKQKNRNFNDHYNQFFHSLRKHLTLNVEQGDDCIWLRGILYILYLETDGL